MQVGIEYFQKFNVRGDDGNQIALVLAFQLCRAQPAQRTEHPVPNQRQQLKGNEMVAGLLGISEKSPGKSKHDNGGKKFL